jgi:membrane protease YdiL (CAAX protease family)
MKKNLSLLYILLALGITWLLWIPALIMTANQGYPLPTIAYLVENRSFEFLNTQHTLTVISFSLAVYGPLLAGLVVSLVGGWKRTREWFAPVLHWKVNIKWYGLALLIVLAIALLPVLVGLPLGMVTARAGYIFPSVSFILFLLVYQFLTSGLGEEPGWRAFLLPYWTEKLGQEKAVWYSGLIWALWHFPFTIFYTLQGTAGMSVAGQLSMVIPALIGQVMGVIGMVYIYTWLLEKTGSVFLAMVFHALSNTTTAVVSASISAQPIINLAMAAMPWLVVVAIDKFEKRGTAKKAAES